MNRYYSSTDRYRPSGGGGLYSTASLSRSKSPYRSTSSLNSHNSSSTNLNVNTDNFDRLNKSLRRHDTSFMDETASSSTKNDSDSRDYGSSYSLGKKKGGARSGAGGGAFNVDKLNKDYSKDYGKYSSGLSKLDDASYSSSASDYDLNNNYSSAYGGISSLGKKEKPLVKQSNVCANSSSSSSDNSDYEPSSVRPYKAKTTTTTTSSYSSPYRSSTLGSGLKPSSTSYTTSSYKTADKGDHYREKDQEVEREETEALSGEEYSDESMSEYLHCKSYCPDSVSDSKLFVSFQ